MYRNRAMVWSVLLVLALLSVVAVAGVASAESVDYSASIVHAQMDGVPSLDPANPGGSMTAQEVFRNIYDNLVMFDEDLQPQPALATRWTVSKDGTEWTFYLRKGVKFQDGTPFSAEAVKFTFDRILDPSSASAVRSLFIQLKEVDVVDDYTVKLVTKEPFGPMLNYLAHALAGIVSPTAVKKWGADYRFHPVGTGPYKISEFVPNEKVVIVRNENYWGGEAKLAKITFIPVREEGTRVMMLQTGQVDSVVPFPINYVAQFKNSNSVEILNRPIISMMYVGFNLSKDLFKDIRVRQALTYAIDRETLVDKLLLGAATLADSPVAKHTWGYQGFPMYQYSPAKAKALLAEAGWKDTNGDGILEKGGTPLRFELWTPQGLYVKDTMLAQTIQAWWKAIGADVRLKTLEAASWYDTLKVPENKATYDAFLWSLTPSTGDGYQQLVELVRSDKDTGKPPMAWNLTHYENPKVDELIATAGSTTDPKERRAALSEAQKMVVQDAPLVFLYSLNQVVGVRARLQGVRIMPNRFVDFREAYVQK